MKFYYEIKIKFFKKTNLRIRDLFYVFAEILNLK